MLKPRCRHPFTRFTRSPVHARAFSLLRWPRYPRQVGVDLAPDVASQARAKIFAHAMASPLDTTIVRRDKDHAGGRTFDIACITSDIADADGDVDAAIASDGGRSGRHIEVHVFELHQYWCRGCRRRSRRPRVRLRTAVPRLSPILVPSLILPRCRSVAHQLQLQRLDHPGVQRGIAALLSRSAGWRRGSRRCGWLPLHLPPISSLQERLNSVPTSWR